jgi:hypothetical protein
MKSLRRKGDQVASVVTELRTGDGWLFHYVCSVDFSGEHSHSLYDIQLNISHPMRATVQGSHPA